MKYQIVNVEVPKASNASHATAKGESKYPFRDLEVGQSFFVPNLDANIPDWSISEASRLGNMKTHCSRWSLKILPGRRFHAAVNPNDNRWLQVWRSA